MKCNIEKCKCILGKTYTEINYKSVLIMELYYLISCLSIKINRNNKKVLDGNLNAKIFELSDTIDEIYGVDDFYLPSYCPIYLTNNALW